jgi:hypothetical protein
MSSDSEQSPDSDQIHKEQVISQDVVYKYASPPNPLPPQVVTIMHEKLKYGMPNMELM